LAPSRQPICCSPWSRPRKLCLRAAWHGEPWPVRVIIDAHSARGAETVSKAARGRDGGKLTNGRRRHLIVDQDGLLVGLLVTPADVQECAAARVLLTRLHAAHPTTQSRSRATQRSNAKHCRAPGAGPASARPARRRSGGFIATTPGGVTPDPDNTVPSATRRHSPQHQLALVPAAQPVSKIPGEGPLRNREQHAGHQGLRRSACGMSTSTSRRPDATPLPSAPGGWARRCWLDRLSCSFTRICHADQTAAEYRSR
jgi:hypothetical protein